MFSIQNSYAELINVNPDPDGEPWIAGGITPEDWDQMTANLPSLDRNLPKGRAKTAADNPPDKVDNSILPAFRPIFNQKGGSCIHASEIGYVFTYEINTLRRLESNDSANQYPYDFSFNFCNIGSSIYGQGYEIAQLCGIPNVKTYGGFGLGDSTRWMSGYDKYYAGMANRALDQFTIKVNTTAGILQMRQWLNDHGTGAENGGCLTFVFGSSPMTLTTLAPGTPEGGKAVLPAFGTTAGHSATIAGYNDSVRYDYNGDGRYTNDIDINHDGVVDLKDWEIGALYMVNSWGESFGNNGKIFIPYKLLTDTNGCLGNLVVGIRTDSAVMKPKFTFKISLSHDNRGLLRIRAGFADNDTATRPADSTISFGSAFNYTGGEYPMQGINADPIEIGLDVSRLAENCTASRVTFFLLVDVLGGIGTVHQFSLMDYRNGTPVETVCDQKEVATPMVTPTFPRTASTLTLKVIKTLNQVNTNSPAQKKHTVSQIAISGNILALRNAGDKVSIIKLDGSQCLSRNLCQDGTLNISTLPAGVYLARTGTAILRFVR